jgi:hypothetical protein
MKTLRLWVLCLLSLLTLTQGAVAQSLSQERFEAKFYGVSEISRFGIDKERFDELTQSQREGVLQGKKVLFDVLKAIQDKNGRPNAYLADSLNKKYPTKQLFAQSVMDEETSLIALIVSDFSVDTEGHQVELAFSVVSSSEGTMVVNQKKALLQAVGSTWKLVRIS